jgi:hypothetical protein
MSAYSATAARHPQIASIPDPKHSEGVRAYREPAAPHPLQLAFLGADGERTWIEEMRSLLAAGRVAEADARLAAELAPFDGGLARLCKATSADDILVEGWEDLLPILAEWEGPPITAITFGLTNPPDLVFEAGRIHDPDLLFGLYSDESFAFSGTSRADLLAECTKDMPDWIDGEEDVEFYCSLSGLAPLNTALINCKHRHFLRDGRDGVEGRAPGGYVEFILGSWLLATRFLQAAERAIADHGLPDGCRLIAGTVGVNADFATILGPEQPGAPASTPRPTAAQPGFATLTAKPWVPREDPTADPAGLTIRQRLQPPVAAPALDDGADPAAAPRSGFLGRLLGRFRRG